MDNRWKPTVVALLLGAGLGLAPCALAQNETQQQQPQNAEKQRQEEAARKQKEKDQQKAESIDKVLQMLQPALQKAAQSPEQPNEQPRQQQIQQRNRPPQYQPPDVPQNQWQPRSRDHRNLPDLDRQPPQLDPPRQRDQIRQQKQRTIQFDRELQNGRRDLERRGTELQRQHRRAQYRYHQQYLDHMREQQRYVKHPHDYFADPFFSTGASYRYFRNGRWIMVNYYAAQILEDAANAGYEQGHYAGLADRDDGWRFDYENSFAYLDANYGYSGYYVSADDYRFYFREGFRRGYEDGYYGRHRYGSEVDGEVRLMTDVLRLIIDLQVLR